MLTYALEFLFQLGLVLTVGGTKVEIRVISLVETVWRSSCANGQYRCCWSLIAFHCRHVSQSLELPFVT